MTILALLVSGCQLAVHGVQHRTACDYRSVANLCFPESSPFSSVLLNQYWRDLTVMPPQFVLFTTSKCTSVLKSTPTVIHDDPSQPSTLLKLSGISTHRDVLNG